jgi:hypothetical protein
MTIDWENIFKDIGCNVRQVNILLDHVIPSEIVAETEKKVARFTDGEARLALLSEMLAQDEANAEAVRKMARGVVDIVKSYITDSIGPVDFASTRAALDELLAEMESRMAADSQAVDANAVSAGAPVAGSGNYGTGTCGTVTPNQMAKTQNFRVECYQRAAGQRGATFHVYASLDGLLDASAEAGVLYDTGNNPGGVKFTVGLPVLSEAGDQANQLSNWSLSGFQKGVNTAADGKIYVKLAKPGADTVVSLYTNPNRTDGLVAEGKILGGTSGNVTLAAKNGSGLTGTVDAAYTTDDSDIEIVPPFEYREGDVFTFSTASDEAGTFQCFFRDNLERSLPANGAGSETILDSWAE